MINLVIFHLVGRYAAADADIEPAVAEMIEHADFLDQPQRRIKRQQIDERPEAHPLYRARYSAEIDAGYGHHVQRGSVMLGNVQAINAGRFGGFHKFQPFIKQFRQRPLAMLDMVKQSDLHNAFRSLSISYAPVWRPNIRLLAANRPVVPCRCNRQRSDRRSRQ